MQKCLVGQAKSVMSHLYKKGQLEKHQGISICSTSIIITLKTPSSIFAFEFQVLDFCVFQTQRRI